MSPGWLQFFLAAGLALAAAIGGVFLLRSDAKDEATKVHSELLVLNGKLDVLLHRIGVSEGEIASIRADVAYVRDRVITHQADGHGPTKD